MNELVRDLKTHPLVPGSLLAAISGDSNARRLAAFDHCALLKFNKQTTVENVGALQDAGLMNAEQATKVLAVDAEFVRWFRDLSLNIPEVADAAGCDETSPNTQR